MTDWFDDELELVEISDASGRKVEMCRLATIEYSGKLYHVLGAVYDDETDDVNPNDQLLVVRQDCTSDGEKEYVVAEDEAEIEQVFGQYAIESMLGEIDEAEETWPCGENHRPGEFCCCGQRAYLQ